MVTYLYKSDSTAVTAGSVVQTWLQLRDWDLQSTSFVPSYANFVCNHSVTSVGNAANGSAAGSCGSTTLASKSTGNYNSVKGTTSINGSTCNIQTIVDSSANQFNGLSTASSGSSA